MSHACRHLVKVMIDAILSVLLLQEPATACSPQELAVDINTLTDLMIAQESGQLRQHSRFHETHAHDDAADGQRLQRLLQRPLRKLWPADHTAEKPTTSSLDV